MKKQKKEFDFIGTTYFMEDDEDFSGDYSWIELRRPNGELVVWYGDYYHDKGSEKMDGFLDGVKFALNRPINVKWENKTSSEYSPDGDSLVEKIK